MKEIIIASSNKGKIKEVQEIFGEEFKVVSMKELGIDIDIEEDKETFEENAIKKAEEIAKTLKSSTKWVIADDSGIEVDVLDGFPGVRTKRWFSGTDRERNLALIKKLEEKIKEQEESCKSLENKSFSDNRKIRFVTAIACSNGVKSFCELGIIEGRVATAPRGENGFGFDEIFELEDGRTLAELTDEEKNKISARKIALEKIKGKIG